MFDRWSFDRWNMAIFKHGSLDSFLQKIGLQPGIHQIQDGEVRLHLNLRTRKSKVLAVISHGSMQSTEIETYTMPRFSGTNIASGIDVDLLLLSDATLSLSKTNIGLGWYCGSSDYDLPSRLAPIVTSVIKKRNYEKVIFVGGSGGGFASLRLVKQFPGSTVIVWNPQTDLEHYHPGVLKAFCDGCFEQPNYKDIPETVRRERGMNLREAHRVFPDANIVYLQNFSDHFHLGRHAIPYVTECLGADARQFEKPGINLLNDHFLMVLGDWGEGHVPPVKSCLTDILRLAVEENDMDGLMRGFHQQAIMNGLYARARGLPTPAQSDA